MNPNLTELLKELHEYMTDKADAETEFRDIDTVTTGNKEARFAGTLEYILEHPKKYNLKIEDFTPVIGMHPKEPTGNGHKGVIEFVGKDYFILRSFKTNQPLIIKPYEYHNFKDYTL